MYLTDAAPPIFITKITAYEDFRSFSFSGFCAMLNLIRIIFIESYTVNDEFDIHRILIYARFIII